MPRNSQGEWTRDGVTPCPGTLKIDGSIQLPRELLEFLTWREGERLTAELSGDDRGLVLHRARDICAHCGAGEGLIRVTRDGEDTGTCICQSCLEGIRVVRLQKNKRPPCER